MLISLGPTPKETVSAAGKFHAYVAITLSPETQPPKGVKDSSWNPTGLYRVL